jgi:ABC-type branched-subunit amino acid transport system substrate-binding protein
MSRLQTCIRAGVQPGAARPTPRAGVRPRAANRRQCSALRIIGVVAVVLFLTTACAGNNEVPIGAVLSLSGPAALPDVKRGMDLAIEEVNDTGGVNGRPLQLHVEDSESDPARGAEAVATLDQAHEPLLIFSTLSSVTTAVSAEAEQREIPLIGLVATDPSIPRNKDWTYVFYPSAEHETNPIFSFIRSRELRTIGILYNDDAYGRSIVSEMERRAAGTVVTIDSAAYASDTEQLTSALESFEQHDAVYLVGFPSQLATMQEALGRHGYDGTILGTSTMTLPSLRREHDLSGTVAAAPLLYNDVFVFAQEASERYHARYDESLNHYAATGYDIIKIVAGLLNGEDLSRRRVIEVLEEGFIYPGVFGEIRLPPGENNIFFPLYAAEIQNGELDYLQ